jgi:hypothetical protein
MKYGAIAGFALAAFIGSSAHAATVTEQVAIKQATVEKADALQKVYWHRRWRSHYRWGSGRRWHRGHRW